MRIQTCSSPPYGVLAPPTTWGPYSFDLDSELGEWKPPPCAPWLPNSNGEEVQYQAAFGDSQQLRILIPFLCMIESVDHLVQEQSHKAMGFDESFRYTDSILIQWSLTPFLSPSPKVRCWPALVHTPFPCTTLNNLTLWFPQQLNAKIRCHLSRVL